MKLFTSDLHLQHVNIIRYSKRPFSSTDEMTVAFIQSINRMAKKGDLLYFLGDWSLNRSALLLLDQISIPVYFVFGNHDAGNRNQILESSTVERAGDILEIKLGPDSTSATLCHYAMRTWNKSHHGALQLHGHSHGTLPEHYNQLDVGVDNAFRLLGEYRPFTETEILEQIARINKTAPSLEHDDHH